MILSMVIDGTSIHKYVFETKMHPSLEMHLYICICSIYANNLVVLPLSMLFSAIWTLSLTAYYLLQTAAITVVR